MSAVCTVLFLSVYDSVLLAGLRTSKCVRAPLACLRVPRKVEEVPVDGDSAGGYSVGTLDKPTTRLSQYARGKTGSMNPFTPGGEV